MTNTLKINDLDLTNLSLYTYKNYNQVATTINQPILRGNAKSAQLKEWSRFFKWTTYGHKWTITDIYIYEKDKPKVARSDSVVNLTYILGSVLLNKTPNIESYNKVALSLNDLAEAFGLYNSICSEYKFQIKGLADKNILYNTIPALNDYNNYHIRQVIDRLEAKARMKVDSLLKHFDTNYIISYRKGFRIQYKGQVDWEIAEREVQVLIEGSISAALLTDKFRYSTDRSTTLGDIFLRNGFNEFFKLVGDDTRLVELGVKYFRPCYLFEFDNTLSSRLESYAKANNIQEGYREKIKQEVKELMEKQRIAIQVKENNILAEKMLELEKESFLPVDREVVIKDNHLYSLTRSWEARDISLVDLMVDGFEEREVRWKRKTTSL